MLRWLKSLFAWRYAFEAGVYDYQFNEVTGARRAIRNTSIGHSPVNMAWLLAGHGMPTINGIPAWRSEHRNELPPGMQWG